MHEVWLRLIGFVVLIAVTEPAWAGEVCPSRLDGHLLSEADGVTVYRGEPWKNEIVPPSISGSAPVWRFQPRPPGVLNVVCQYDNYGRAIVEPVPFAATECRRAGHRFSCNG